MSSNDPVWAEGLIKRFDKAEAVKGVSLSAPQGEIYGVLGPNGAGKTTTLRMLLGILDPDAGERTLLGHSKPREAGTNGTGKFVSAALEASNVDLAEQLTDMIVAQRAYQANTRVIKTTDELLEQLNQI